MVDWDAATYEALQEDAPRNAAILSDQVIRENVELRNQVSTLSESLDEVRMMLDYEDRGWQLISQIGAGEHLEGLDLDEVKDLSQRIRPRLAAQGLTKRGADLHSGYVWSKGLNIEGVKPTGKRGTPSNLQKFYNRVTNQESLFSALAHEELQKARFADGNVFILCDTAKRTARVIPIKDITGVKVDPDFPSDVIAYRREWKPDEKKPAKVEWYYTNRWDGPKQRTFTQNKVTETINRNAVIVDRRFNKSPGYVLGIPDAVAAMPWIAAYDEMTQNGMVVTESLAKILYKVISKSKTTAASVGVKLAGFNGTGGTASMMEGQDLAAISTAGKGYDFGSYRAIGAMAAAALNVPNAELLSDSAAAGSSYGALSALTPSTKNAMRLMQAEWIELYLEVFEVFSLGRPRIWFDSLEDVDQYRASQSLTLLSSTLSDEEFRAAALDLLDIAGDPSQIPETLKLRSQPAQTAATQGSPGQGVSNDSAGSGANDLRSDTISQESLRSQMANDDFLARLEELVNRMEAAGG
jgi:hypothetical protein